MPIRLLIAEGDPAAARMLDASLVRYGFEITHASDGEDAVAKFQPRLFDVVLLDVSLPRKSGIEAARAIRTSPGGNQVGLVLTSGNTVSPDTVLELRRAQVDAWFNKPLSLRDLRDKLAELAHKYTGATAEALRVEAGRKALRAPQQKPAEKEKAPPSTSAAKTQPIARSAVAAAAAAVATAKAVAKPAASEAPKPRAAPPAQAVAARAVEPVIVGPSSTPGFAAPPHTGSDKVAAAPAAPTGPPLGKEPVSIVEMHASARMMLALARSRVTGVYVLTQRDSEAKVAFIKGVMVGASDSDPSNRLLTRLVRRDVIKEGDVEGVMAYAREHKLRVAEALLANELCSAETLLDELELQAAERLGLAAAWRAGEMRFYEDRGEVEKLAISSFDAYEALFRRFDNFGDSVMLGAWLDQNGAAEVKTSRDFEDGLVAYARVSPSSPLPGILFTRPANLKALAAVIVQWAPGERDKLLAHVYGMWVAGLLRLPNDAPPDERPVPRPVRSEEVAHALPDKDAVREIRAEWLRAQGRNFYEALGIEQDASIDAVVQGLALYRERFGREALAQRNLGPAEGLAAELFALIDDIESTLLDEEQRELYDAALREIDEPTAMETHLDADAHFIEGKLALANGDIVAAKAAFELAATQAPDEAEYKSFLAWTEFLDGAALVDSAMAVLRAAASASPGAMRPIFMIGLAAERLGNLQAALAAFQETARRAPNDAEVWSALSRVQAALRGVSGG